MHTLTTSRGFTTRADMTEAPPAATLLSFSVSSLLDIPMRLVWLT